jgi:hypothetical protein
MKVGKEKVRMIRQINLKRIMYVGGRAANGKELTFSICVSNRLQLFLYTARLTAKSNKLPHDRGVWFLTVLRHP